MTTTLLILSIELIVILLAAVGWLGYSAHKQKTQRRNALQKLLGAITKSESERLSALDGQYLALGADESKSNMAARKLILAEKQFFQALVAATLDKSGDQLATLHQPTQALIDQCLEQAKTSLPEVQPTPEPPPVEDTHAAGAEEPSASDSDDIEVTMDEEDTDEAPEETSGSMLDDIEVTMDEDEPTEPTDQTDQTDEEPVDSQPASLLNDDIEVTLDESDDEPSDDSETVSSPDDIEVTMEEEETPPDDEPEEIAELAEALPSSDDIEVTLDDEDAPDQTETFSSDEIEVTLEEDSETSDTPTEPVPAADDIEVTMDPETKDSDITKEVENLPEADETKATPLPESDQEEAITDQPSETKTESLLNDDIEVILDEDDLGEEVTDTEVDEANEPESLSEENLNEVDTAEHEAEVALNIAEAEPTQNPESDTADETYAESEKDMDVVEESSLELDAEEPSSKEASAETAPAQQDDIEKAVDQATPDEPDIKTKSSATTSKVTETDDPLDLSWLDEMENDATSFEPDLDLEASKSYKKKPTDQSD